MQGYSILKNLFDQILLTDLTSCVYHSVIIRELEKGERYPVYPSGGDELVYTGIDDTKQMNVYVRQTDDLIVTKTDFIGGCTKLYNCTIPHRMVVFNDYEVRNHDSIIAMFMEAMFIPGIRFKKLIVDKVKLSQLETTAKAFNFGETTLYTAFDFDVLIQLQSNNCDLEINCNSIPNPYCHILIEEVLRPETCDFNEDFSEDFYICGEARPARDFNNDFNNDFK